jgi:hypothetical protein
MSPPQLGHRSGSTGPPEGTLSVALGAPRTADRRPGVPSRLVERPRGRPTTTGSGPRGPCAGRGGTVPVVGVLIGRLDLPPPANISSPDKYEPYLYASNL